MEHLVHGLTHKKGKCGLRSYVQLTRCSEERIDDARNSSRELPEASFTSKALSTTEHAPDP